MKRFYASLTILLALPVFLWAQAGELIVKRGEKGLYLEHKVMPKEGLFPLGRLYNVHPRQIANYNGIDYNKGLVIGQILRIPLSDTNFNQKSEQGVPVFYRTGEKEALTRISNLNNKVSLENLRSWNKLESDNVDVGKKLVIGFLVSKEIKPPVSVAVTDNKKEPVVPNKPAVTEEKKEEIKAEVKTEAEIIQPKQEEMKPVEIKQQEKKQDVVPAVKIESSGEGFFKWHYEQQAKQQSGSKDQTVTSGIFKTTSGWSDGKYYLLMDEVQPGTIVRITNPSNNRSVYAKALGKMEGINLNKGLDIRISNAAASNLGVSETDKFIVKVNY